MKNLTLTLIALTLFLSCKKETEKQTDTAVENTKTAYQSFGGQIEDTDALDAVAMNTQFNKMNVGDTLNTKFVATVGEVCQAKGCWMKLNLENGQQVMVKFKDYGFFMPKDIKGKQVVVNGIAFVNEMPVDEQKHYAEDAGKSKEEIDAIVAPLKIFSFEADGVLLKQ